jgi:hypothetical protein
MVYRRRLGLRNVFHEPKENSLFDLKMLILSWVSGPFSRQDEESPFLGVSQCPLTVLIDSI